MKQSISWLRSALFAASIALCSQTIAAGTPPTSVNEHASPAGVSSTAVSDQAFIEWTQKHAIRLSTVEAGHGFEDMQALKKVVGNARIVALGEATHGTREFFQLKHRMLEFLASQMDFTIFSIEASMPEAYRLNDFVVNGNGDPKQLLKGMYFWTWNTEEVLDMILWMREFNRSGKGHIEFTGFDMQFPTMAMDTVRKFVIAEDRPYDTALWPIYEDVSRLVRETQTKAAGTDKEPSINRALKQQMLTQRCKDVVKHLESNRANFLLAGADPKTSDWAIQNARLVVQYVQMKTGEKSRDESMAENVKWIADHSPGAKLVLWAHNGHVGYKGSYRFTPMGGYLRSTFGTELVNFGFAFNEGSFRAVELGKGLHDFTVGKLPEGSLDGTLGSAGIPFLAMDLRQMPKEGPVAEWLSQPRDTRSIGAVYSETTSSVQMMRPQDSYDVLLFINKTTAARANH